jgi:hypothetical protein
VAAPGSGGIVLMSPTLVTENCCGDLLHIGNFNNDHFETDQQQQLQYY